MSLLESANLPDGFGYLLLVISLILTLAPWLHGRDFGILKIPQFESAQRRKLKLAGPAILALAILLHFPIPTGAPDTETIHLQPAHPPIKSVQLSPDLAKMQVLAPWKSSGCLFPADLLKRDNGSGVVHFGFDERVTMQLAQIYKAVEPKIFIGALVYAKLPNRDAWLPVTVRNYRNENVQVVSDETASCAAEFGKNKKWLPQSSLIDIQSLGDGL